MPEPKNAAAQPAAQPSRWYDIRAALEAGVAEVMIYGDIGDRWDENGVVAADLVRDLAAVTAARIVVRINSYGGSVPDALAIYNALKRHPAAIDVQVDGVAISSASLIAMAGDTVTMAENALLMIHAPWTVALGNAAELRETAAMLDVHARAMTTSYVAKSGKSEADVLALLSDGKDHWYTAAEAKAEGFCDAVGPELAVAASLARGFDLARYRDRLQPAPAAAGDSTAPAAAGLSTKENAMPDLNKPAAATEAAATEQVVAAITERNAAIIAAYKPFAEREGVAALEKAVLADAKLTADEANARLLAHLAKDTAPARPAGSVPRVETLVDEHDKRREAVSAALLERAGVRMSGKAADLAGNPFRGAKLLDVARDSLRRAGVKTDGMTQMELVAAAFTQSTSDFPILLENTMHKSLQAAYAVAALTWRRFAATGSVSDFRAHPRYRVGSLSSLDSINELGEFKNKTIPDGEKASITATTKGNIINLSRQAVINDDLGAFVGLASALGRAAARSVEVSVYALLAQNSNLGPTMSDGNALFHASHANIAATGALSMTVVDDIRVKMASQTDVGGNDYLDLRPAVLLVPMGSGGTARSINEAQYDPDTANKLQKPNTVRGLFRDIVDTPRLSGTRVYAFADPMEAPVLEVAFLDGQQEPFLELQNGFTVDGAQWKVRLDYGVAAIDYRGAVTAAGA